MQRYGSDKMKTYNLQHGIGKAKHVINFHDGIKTYPDGSPFFDIALFKNKKEFQSRIKELESNGYIKG
jgi:hypothetical protein